ncbi:MAG: peptide deformylase [Patescibacteria group bacterium]|nr:peptide deformylase [Patescibacteria group bacterium]
MSGNIKEIIHHPHPTLRKKSSSIPEKKITQKNFQQFLDDLEVTMLSKDGAGLAAPQIGINDRVVVIAKEGEKSLFLINPQIIKKSWGKAIEEEGCLSVIDDKGRIIYGPVERHKRITCSYYDRSGKKKKIQGDERLSRVIQHEVDHLDGVLFIDHLMK